jgi:hypothetical protein
LLREKTAFEDQQVGVITLDRLKVEHARRERSRPRTRQTQTEPLA